jgi:SAM-dependent methyltransferase
MNHDPDDLAPTQRFSSRVENYAKYRPSYPPGILPLLTREAGFSPDFAVADVGSGTGLLTELFLRNGNQVFAIEPNAEMRQAAERLLARYPSFHSLSSTGEATGLPDASVDGVVIAQAFHWLDRQQAAAEFRRITRPGGFVALIWNVRASHTSPLMAEYERIIKTYGSPFARSGNELVPFEILRELFPGMTLHVLPNHQDLDWDGLRGRLLSSSYIPLAGQEGYEQMIGDLRAVFDRFNVNGQVRMDYETRLYLTKNMDS